jgi:hypothetical protein
MDTEYPADQTGFPGPSRQKDTRPGTSGPGFTRGTAENRTAGDDASFSERLKERASVQLDDQRHRATRNLGGVARFVRQATDEIESQGHLGFAGYGRKAADRIDELSRQLERKDLDQVIADVERFARQQPALFVGAAFGVGVLAGRFLLSSAGRVPKPSAPPVPGETSAPTGMGPAGMPTGL